MLVDVDDLAAMLDAKSTIAVDCRFRLTEPDAGARAFEAGHIPGARYAHLDRDLAGEPGVDDGRHPLPAPAKFAATLGRLGIDEQSHVTVYDDAGGAIAARLWWMLRVWLGHRRVALLNGGLNAWLQRGYALESGPSGQHETHYGAGPVAADRLVATKELPDLLQRGHVLWDARAAARYRGEMEPIDPVAGHVPGAVNLPFERCLDESGRFLAADRLAALFNEAMAGRPPEQCIAMCGSGVTACHLLLAMAVAGLEGARLYAGSWSEWIRDPARPIATGD